MSGRPDYVHCVLTGKHDANREPEKRTWCGREDHGWAYVDASHAALNAKDGGYLLTCRRCAEKIAEALLGHTWGRSTKAFAAFGDAESTGTPVATADDSK